MLAFLQQFRDFSTTTYIFDLEVVLFVGFEVLLFPIAFLEGRAGRKCFLVHSPKPLIIPVLVPVSVMTARICILPGSDKYTFLNISHTVQYDLVYFK